MSHDMESCDQGGEDQDKACLMDRLQWRRASQDFEARDREAVKLGQDLAPMDRDNGEERARSRSMDQRRSCDNMEWIISFKKDQAKC